MINKKAVSSNCKTMVLPSLWVADSSRKSARRPSYPAKVSDVVGAPAKTCSIVAMLGGVNPRKLKLISILPDSIGNFIGSRLWTKLVMSPGFAIQFSG